MTDAIQLAPTNMRSLNQEGKTAVMHNGELIVILAPESNA